jgi:hypothetical protein
MEENIMDVFSIIFLLLQQDEDEEEEDDAMHRHADGSLCLFSSSSLIYGEESRVTGKERVLKGADAEPSRAFITGAETTGKKRTHTIEKKKKIFFQLWWDRLHDFAPTSQAAAASAALIIFFFIRITTCVGVRVKKEKFGVLYDR